MDKSNFDTLYLKLAKLRTELRVTLDALGALDAPGKTRLEEILREEARAIDEAHKRAADEIEKARAILDAVHESPEYSQLLGVVEKKEQEISHTQSELEGVILATFDEDEKAARALRGVRITDYRRPVYDIPIAIAWCKSNLPSAVETKLKAREFEKHARAVASTAPLKFVDFVSEPKIDIDTDIVGYEEMKDE